MIAYLDLYCGYPGDPDLPVDYLGSTDEVLAGRDATELFDLMDFMLPIAEERVAEEPRLLFEVGRAAYRLGYYEQAEEWIGQAADAGSAGALAWLGAYEYERGDIEAGLSQLREAADEGFQARWLDNLLSPAPSAVESAFSDFRRADIIEALYAGDYAKVRELKPSGVHYYLKALNETLTNTEILFLVDAPELLLETLPEITSVLKPDQTVLDWFLIEEISGWVARSDPNNRQALAIASANGQGKQDGYRLALMYQRDYESFKRIYQAIAEYALNQLN